jgi:hypothetical protein
VLLLLSGGELLPLLEILRGSYYGNLCWKTDFLNIPKRERAMDAQTPMNIVAIFDKKTGERFIFFYDDVSGDELRRLVDSFVANPDLNFTEDNALNVKSKIKMPPPQVD